MRSHWSDGHLYSGDRVRKLQNKHYFLIDTGAGEKVFLHLHDAECYCMEHKLDPDEAVKSGDPETWLRAIKLAQTNSFILKEQAERLHKLMDEADQEIDRLVAVRDRHEETQKRNFDKEFDAEQVRNAVAKRSGIYEAIEGFTQVAKDEAVEEFLENWEKEAEVAADGYLQFLQSTREELEAVIRKGEAGQGKKEILIQLKRIHQNINNNL